MRIVLSPIGSAAEIQPFLVLGAALRARGHIVSFCVAEKFRTWITQSGFPMFSSGDAFQELMAAPPRSSKEMERAFRKLASDVPVQFVALRDACKEADMLVGAMLQLAGPSIAENFKIPYVSVVFNPFYLREGSEPPLGQPLKGGFLNLFHQRVLAHSWRVDCLFSVNQERNYMHLPSVDHLTKYVFQSGHVLLAFDPELAVVPDSSGGSYTVIGSIFPDQEEAPEDRIRNFLSAAEGPIYFHLGTEKTVDSEELGRTCMEAVHLLKKRALFSSGWITFDSASVPSSDFLVAGILPRDAVLSKCSLIVHDGSSSVTAAAVRAGVPQLIVPAYADQLFWARAVEAKGVAGSPICRWDVEAKTLARAIQEVLNNGSLKTKAKSLGDRLRSRSGTVKAVEVIERIGAASIQAV